MHKVSNCSLNLNGVPLRRVSSGARTWRDCGVTRDSAKVYLFGAALPNIGAFSAIPDPFLQYLRTTTRRLQPLFSNSVNSSKMDAQLEEQLAKEMEAMLLGESSNPESSLQRHPQARPTNISNRSKGFPTDKAPRLTRKDVSKLPRSIRKTHTEEELEYLFNEDGYLSPQLQALIDADIATPVSVHFIIHLVTKPSSFLLQSCYVCQAPSKDRCAGCNLVF